MSYPDTGFCIMKCNEINVRVRYQETDQMGIVYYSNYFVYFEMGRIEFLRNHGISYAEIEKENIFLAVAEAHCKYRAPAMFDDLLVIKTCLSKMKHARIEFCYEIRRNNEEKLIAEGFTRLACLDINRKPTAIPEKVRNALT
ncbi:MAG: thioesterase family protein [Candidatus Scalindua sp.]|nr:thioesterase family protein [Candidatus Scalindua sp.]